MKGSKEERRKMKIGRRFIIRGVDMKKEGREEELNKVIKKQNRKRIGWKMEEEENIRDFFFKKREIGSREGGKQGRFRNKHYMELNSLKEVRVVGEARREGGGEGRE